MFQQKDQNAWFGPALVICKRGQSVWLHSMGDIKKVASCKVKPYELVERNVPDSNQDQDKQVMLEDGLRDVKSVHLEEEESKLHPVKVTPAKESISSHPLKVHKVSAIWSLGRGPRLQSMTLSYRKGYLMPGPTTV